MSDERPHRVVLVAPDKFKGCLSAAAVAAALSDGLRVRADVTAVLRPVADGGEGTVDALVRHGFLRRSTRALDPHGREVTAEYAVRGDVGVVELAAASGLHLVDVGSRSPLTASTYGTGQVVAAALKDGARHIIVGTGGSATTDGGAGLLVALGARLLDHNGRALAGRPCDLAALTRVDLSELRTRLGDARLTVAADVTNPLLGKQGAARVFGPQKGASAQDIRNLEEWLHRWAEVLESAAGRDGRNAARSGAAGGAAFGLMVAVGASAVSGIDLLLEVSDFHEKLAEADLVVTGEGELDRQSLGGKAPYGVAQAARAHGVPVVAVVGRNRLSAAELREAGFQQVHDLTEIAGDTSTAMTMTTDLLEGVGQTIAEELHRNRDPVARPSIQDSA